MQDKIYKTEDIAEITQKIINTFENEQHIILNIHGTKTAFETLAWGKAQTIKQCEILSIVRPNQNILKDTSLEVLKENKNIFIISTQNEEYLDLTKIPKESFEHYPYLEEFYNYLYMTSLTFLQQTDINRLKTIAEEYIRKLKDEERFTNGKSRHRNKREN